MLSVAQGAGLLQKLPVAQGAGLLQKLPVAQRAGLLQKMQVAQGAGLLRIKLSVAQGLASYDCACPALSNRIATY